MKKIRKIIAASLILLNTGLIITYGNSSYANSDSMVSIEGERAMPDASIAHFESNSLKDFLLWLRNPNDNKETFKELIEHWTNAGAYLVPEFEGGQLNKIFVDSNQTFISFVFNEPELRVTETLCKAKIN